MSSIVEDFYNAEKLFRGVVEVNWVPHLNRPSSAAFKDSMGCSVDRQFRRDVRESLNSIFKNSKFRCVVSVNVLNIKTIEALVKYVPLEDNIFHSEIHRNDDKPALSSGQVRQLSNVWEVHGK
jgi:hypothetical protein